MWEENTFTTRSCHINISAFSDNQLLHDAVKTTNLTLNWQLPIELSALREICDRNEITVNWIANQPKFSDLLRKKGASCQSLMEAIQTGRISNIGIDIPIHNAELQKKSIVDNNRNFHNCKKLASKGHI